MYDLFITKIDANNVIKEYSVYDTKYEMDITCIAHIKMKCDAVPALTDKYKLVDNVLVELSAEELKQIDILPTKTTEERLNEIDSAITDLQSMYFEILMEV